MLPLSKFLTELHICTVDKLIDTEDDHYTHSSAPHHNHHLNTKPPQTPIIKSKLIPQTRIVYYPDQPPHRNVNQFMILLQTPSCLPHHLSITTGRLLSHICAAA